ncbi:MAG: DUF1524 domain-containing protein, partial [Candidatus Poribacteria bacterium]|nr:DUF1524 domain-containing protein [Candidatus Poribacteria bacterium]
YTVEHILPQNEHLSQQWRDALGPEWKRVQETWLHKLGNLTLTGYNAEYSDRPFVEKRDIQGGFKESPLRINEDLRTLDKWDEPAIQARAERLSKKAAHVWAAPSLSDEILNQFRSKPVTTQTYDINNYPPLADGTPMRLLFNDLRTELLALDLCVSEEFLKLYVAYKAETNFVDVVPQNKRLRLSLNMKFHELNDPRGLASDVTNLGRWGNGDVEIGLSAKEQIPYIMGLIRQALERQMGESGD